ncbi:MAG: sodium ion-translocating decarboxylase subunit beta [Spirochaetes bacterium]|nr:sodium ion-translocating decarboxylase subunit beta [Spirochaetota bacterium]
MESTLADALMALVGGFINIHWTNIVMIIVGCVLLYLGIKKGFEPLLLVPIGFGCILVNIPLAELMDEHGFLRIIYDFGVITELFPLFIFIGIGAMTDFRPLIENPYTFLLGAAGQFGIFLTLLLALALGFPNKDAMTIGIIGACDGPTVIYVASKYARHLLGPVSVAAYSYMALVPVLQPPIMRLLTTSKEKVTVMRSDKKAVSKKAVLLFPLVITIIGGIIAPKGLPLIGTIMLGNFLKESGAVARLTRAAENEITNIVTLLLGISIGATMNGDMFLKPTTLLIFGLGFLAICLDTVCGIMFGKLLYVITRGKINPLIGAAGISAFPMSARVVQREGQKYNKRNYLLMPAMAANAGGQVGSIMAAAVMLSVSQGMGIL